MSANLLPAVVYLSVIATILVIFLIGPLVHRLPQRMREHDERARMNRRRRAIDEAKWKDLERRAEFRAGMHRKMAGGA